MHFDIDALDVKYRRLVEVLITRLFRASAGPPSPFRVLRDGLG
jgi:hypothetical protein